MATDGFSMKKSTNPATPNKPLVLTAPASTEEPVTQLGRRHIGQPLGRPSGHCAVLAPMLVGETPSQRMARGFLHLARPTTEVTQEVPRCYDMPCHCLHLSS